MDGIRTAINTLDSGDSYEVRGFIMEKEKKELKAAIEACQAIIPPNWELIESGEPIGSSKTMSVGVMPWHLHRKNVSGMASCLGAYKVHECGTKTMLAHINIDPEKNFGDEYYAVLIHELAHIVVNRTHYGRGKTPPCDAHGACFLRAFSRLIERAAKIFGDRSKVVIFARVDYDRFARKNR